MAKAVDVYKNRTNILKINLGFDVSGDIITSQIRAGKNSSSELLATWSVAPETDGVDGRLVLTIDDSQLTEVTVREGFMDLKRVTGGEPVAVFSDPLEVVFKEVITT